MGYKEVLMPEPLDDGKKREKKEILNTRISPVNFEKINDVADLVESFQSASIQVKSVIEFNRYHHLLNFAIYC